MPKLPVYPADMIEPGSDKPDLAAIVVELRSTAREWSPEAREWLAALVDPVATTPWRLKLSPRGRGRPRKQGLPHIEAVEFFEDRRDALGPKGRKKALGEACDRFGIGLATLEAEIAATNFARDENFRLIEEERLPRQAVERK